MSVSEGIPTSAYGQSNASGRMRMVMVGTGACP